LSHSGEAIEVPAMRYDEDESAFIWLIKVA